MKRKTHRPFAGLTWSQLTAIRDVMWASRYASRNSRAVWALTQKAVPLMTYDRRGLMLTKAGVAVWNAMTEWRPDLYQAKTI
ncbi:hypothetical protein AN189_02915 [Loktanella sp. 3ANDIMAR09]|uniref:hypothetical protein n=1 Tax=Loktanella sp. 3ANDIMAR09 TaxID=1225657 RepID=UPI0006FF2FC9|nr:hypothetical protein [Loktanella sp. 3ANDIMAR09]KQI69392.1 hypothetical protein AN189_02915 [Loktanella sp. 3ANDIMAR09]